MYQTPYQTRAHAPFYGSRIRVLDALDAAAHPDPSRLASKLRDCCQFAQVVADPETGIPRVHERRCKSRLCPRCIALRSQALVPKCCSYLREMDSPRLLTLTLASSDDPLRDQISRLTECFKRLRRHAFWLPSVTGGFYTIECTYNHATHQWHPHLHAVIDGTFMPQAFLAETWRRITGDSRIVDIRLVRSRMEAARYVAGYVLKSSSIEQMPDDAIPEWAAQVHGMRLVQTFGNLHGIKIDTDDDEDRQGHEWIDYADKLARAADDGDADATVIIASVINPRTGLPRAPLAGPSTDTSPGIVAAADSVRRWQDRHNPAPNLGDAEHGNLPPPNDSGRLWPQRERQNDHATHLGRVL